MAEHQWSAEEIREAMGRAADIDVDREVARAEKAGAADTSALRDLLQETKNFAQGIITTPWSALSGSEREGLVARAHSLQQRWEPHQQGTRSRTRDLLGGVGEFLFWTSDLWLFSESLGALGKGLGHALSAAGEGIGDVLEGAGDGLSGIDLL